MSIIIFLLTICICIKTISYGIFEIKANKNKPGGLVVICLGIISLLLPNLVIFFNGSH